MRKPNQQHRGYSLVELSIAIAIAGILGLGTATLISHLQSQSNNAIQATDIDNDLSVASKLIDEDLSRAGANLNFTHLLDSNGNEFFEYLPYSTKLTDHITDSREITLSLNTKDYPKAVDEFVFLVTDKKWPIPLSFSPRKGYLSQGLCKEVASKTYNNSCFFESNIIPEAENTFENPKVMNETEGAYFLFQVPEYFSNNNPEIKTSLLAYSFLAVANAHELSGPIIPQVKVETNTAPKGSTEPNQSNRYTTIRSLHPFKVAHPQTLGVYLWRVPFYSGQGSAVQVTRVRLVKYSIEKRMVGGKETNGLYRLELNVNSKGQYSPARAFLVGEGFEALKLTRKFIGDTIMNVRFIRQFRLNGQVKGN